MVQPVIAPLYDGRSAHEIVALLAGDLQQDGRAIVRMHWSSGEAGVVLADDSAWDNALRNGLIEGSRSPRVDAVVVAPDPASSKAVNADMDGSTLELLFRPDPTVHDGRFSNNGWLQ